MAPEHGRGHTSRPFQLSSSVRQRLLLLHQARLRHNQAAAEQLELTAVDSGVAIQEMKTIPSIPRSMAHSLEAADLIKILLSATHT